MSTVSFSGLGSGLDIDTLVTGLLKASSGPITNANTKISSTQAAISTMTGIGSLLADLKGVVDTLDTASELASVKATSANTDALGISASGAAKQGSYSVRVVALAKEQRTYSSTQTDANLDLTQSGNLRFTQDGTDYDVAIEATDSLNDIAAKINGAGAKISASVFYDGTAYRLQVRGTETGVKNAFTVQEQAGVNLGLAAVGANKQSATDAELLVDTFTVKSSTNTVTGAIEGVTFDLKAETATAFNVSVKSDSAAMKTSLQSFVEKYNSVIGRIHSVAGFGSSSGTSEALRADPTLRAITSGLSNQVLGSAGISGSLNTLADIGIRLNNDGTLKLDDTKLSKALADNPDNFTKVLAGDGTTQGLMDKMRDLLTGYTTTGTGLLYNTTQAMNSRIKLYQDTVTREQARLDAMEARLRKSLNAMDAKVGSTASNSALSSF